MVLHTSGVREGHPNYECAIFQAVDDNAAGREEKSKTVYKRMRFSYETA